MKNIKSCLVLILLLLAGYSATAQTVKYLNRYGNKEVTASEAHYFEITEENGAGGGTITRFLAEDSTKVQQIAYSDLDGGEWKRGIKDGPYSIWHRNGQLSEKGNFENNKQVGTLEKWFGSGNLNYKAFYENGELHDSVMGYYEDGSLRRKEVYQNGEMVKGQVFAKDGSELPFMYSSIMPQFPGGEMQLMKFLGQTIRYPAQAQRKKVSGLVILSFTVQEDGKIDTIEIIESVDTALDAESIRVIKAMPLWEPGLLEGKPVAVPYTLPIRFSIR